MAEFSGRVIEAYFSNNDKDTICVMWNNNASGKEVVEEFYLKTDPDNHYFKELLKDIPLEEIEEHTQKRAVVYMEEMKRLAKRWSFSEPKNIDPKSVDKRVNSRIVDLICDFDKKDKGQQELMFRLKLRLFEQDIVKNSKNTDGKAMIRKAEEPIEVLMAYAETIGKLGKRVKN
tara:strand:+ start:320 stop:841 length:522 start_codon:yes stop_codon:yes gene_type:complete